jgi:hypothetical protein
VAAPAQHLLSLLPRGLCEGDREGTSSKGGETSLHLSPRLRRGLFAGEGNQFVSAGIWKDGGNLMKRLGTLVGVTLLTVALSTPCFAAPARNPMRQQDRTRDRIQLQTQTQSQDRTRSRDRIQQGTQSRVQDQTKSQDQTRTRDRLHRQ